MTGQSIYSRRCSRSTIILMNLIGVSTIYKDVRRGQALLASNSQDSLISIPSHFQTGTGAGFVSGAFDKMNMKDRSST